MAEPSPLGCFCTDTSNHYSPGVPRHRRNSWRPSGRARAVVTPHRRLRRPSTDRPLTCRKDRALTQGLRHRPADARSLRAVSRRLSAPGSAKGAGGDPGTDPPASMLGVTLPSAGHDTSGRVRPCPTPATRPGATLSCTGQARFREETLSLAGRPSFGVTLPSSARNWRSDVFFWPRSCPRDSERAAKPRRRTKKADAAPPCAEATAGDPVPGRRPTDPVGPKPAPEVWDSLL